MQTGGPLSFDIAAASYYHGFVSLLFICFPAGEMSGEEDSQGQLSDERKHQTGFLTANCKLPDMMVLRHYTVVTRHRLG